MLWSPVDRLPHSYGDWVPPPPFPQTDINLITAFPWLRDIGTILSIAAVLNDSATIADYTALYKKAAADFHTAFFTNATIGYADGLQTANALALALPGVVPANLQDSVVAALKRDILTRGHLTTGIVGVAQLFPVLSANGEHDTALFLAQSTTYPSYGWMFTNSVPEIATTLWELWDAPMEGPGMNSRNHIMFGSIGAWFYRDVAGVQLDGLDHIAVRPRMAHDATLMPEVHAEVVTVKGPVTVDYVRSQGEAQQSVELRVQLPHNSRGTVHLEPLLKNGRCALLTEGGRPLMKQQTAASGVYGEGLYVYEVDGVEDVSVDDSTGVVSVRVGAGSYTFTAHWE